MYGINAQMKIHLKLYYPTKHQNFSDLGKNLTQSMLFQPIMRLEVLVGGGLL